MEILLDTNFTKKGEPIQDEQLALILKVGQVSRGGIPIYDFNKILDVYSKH